MRTIKTLLVANRGEIALRVMRTAREMGIQTVAVYSDADATAPHVRFADQAYRVGPAPSAQSYLRMDEILRVAKESGADAIHPGYGFLSENAEFARLCAEQGILFVGPDAHAIQVMGDKLSAKQAVKPFGVPLVPGTDTPIDDVPEAKRLAQSIGFPILIKAAAGGGGKGMRVVHRLEDFEEQMTLAVNEATSAFGNGSVFMEKYVSSPRHIEVQVLADQHGNTVHLFERECSIQRRHQKVIEEAPSVVLTPEQREQMGAAAVRVAQACSYVGAGTVEFIFDASGAFYFLEMNTRLQVEHPVTEMITGVDLVREQLRIAEGLPLSFQQEDLRIHGHALEIRVYAEDARQNFVPDIGTLNVYKRPQGPGIRVDDGMEEGSTVPIYYDPMIAKLVVHAATRDLALARAIRAIDEYVVVGCETTLPFARFVLQHPDFTSGVFDTHFVPNNFDPVRDLAAPADLEVRTAAGLVAQALVEGTWQGGSAVNRTQKSADSAATSPWLLQRGMP
ncbi:MAG: acetyl-CoA carboxylase biotin carboxylase subunit [Schleiferiaceae bacterium]|jgi:acetyl-CoA carboxylase, biotin carboxylase subunit|nr:acetyl-CoA carboxylase biotin carboxylase subunit [Schleiferiaceae bacterium]MDP4626909.1 acetyl-CoA carboxylase biotin carboxylase subunit [Schleiferiaceae bacterium]MDP4728507.1 acetyl-CoA carboxylase biotin carboxylase subunit [Schleiferiaceae bacterium]MDP4750392.1 acetyl-CoA carboxylase biotin carboxylase subunit [Schleiferiaceae bacterium]MDP4859170.1 acetyl-CoA carboxylase biotin carboxylase subunit [Schleiferiaceae bacterium]